MIQACVLFLKCYHLLLANVAAQRSVIVTRGDLLSFKVFLCWKDRHTHENIQETHPPCQTPQTFLLTSNFK